MENLCGCDCEWKQDQVCKLCLVSLYSRYILAANRECYFLFRAFLCVVKKQINVIFRALRITVFVLKQVGSPF